jgi:ferredoxin
MKVRVRSDVCQGHTLCNMLAPEVFQLRDEDGHAYVAEGPIPAELQDRVRRASQNCPEFAIELTDDR